MSNLNNKVEFIGNVGNEVGETLRYVNGAAVVQVSLAVPRGGARRQGEEAVVDWIRCEFWDRQAEILAQYAKKGSKLHVAGTLRIDNYEVEGQKRQKVYAKCFQFEFMGSTARPKEAVTA